MRLKLRHLWTLGRVGAAPLTISVPVLGLYSNNISPTSSDLIAWCILGMCVHLFGFSLNDILDRQIDRAAPSRQGHPLATGELTLREAWFFCLSQIPLSLGIYCLWLDGARNGLMFLCTSIVLSIIYNQYSKRGGLHSIVAEISLAASIGLLCLSGACFNSTVPHLGTLILSTALTLVLLSLNSIASGLKDLKSDSNYGAKSFVVSAGCRVGESGRVIIPTMMKLYAALLQMLIGISILVLLYYYGSSWATWIIAGLLWLYAALHIRLILSDLYYQQLQQSHPLLNGIFNYLAVSLVLMSAMPLALQIFYVFLTVRSFSIPWSRSFRMWHMRYSLRVN